MSRKRIIWTENKVNSFIKQGRGQGIGARYVPWIKVGDFSSLGRSHRIRGVKNGRIHHFFSDLEKKYFYFLMWNEDIIDIREQYPLFPVMETENIAEKLNIKHPSFKGFSVVMTTDFLITTPNGLVARSIKPMSELTNQRTKEKLKIEELYWRKRGVDYKIVTEESFSKTVANNIEKLFGYYEFPFINMTKGEQEVLSRRLIIGIVDNSGKRISDICIARDKEEKMEQGSNLKLFWHLACRKEIPLYMNNKLLATKKVNEIVVINEMKVEERTDEYFSQCYL